MQAALSPSSTRRSASLEPGSVLTDRSALVLTKLSARAVELRLHRRGPAVVQDPCLRIPAGYSLVRDYVAPLRGITAAPARPPSPPKPRKATAWIMTRPASLAAGDRGRYRPTRAALDWGIILISCLLAVAPVGTHSVGRNVAAGHSLIGGRWRTAL